MSNDGIPSWRDAAGIIGSSLRELTVAVNVYVKLRRTELIQIFAISKFQARPLASDRKK
jgi:hypothetical protein